MKKFLAFMLVLGLSSFASGAIVLDIQDNGQPFLGGDVAPSDVITIQWIDNEIAGTFGGYSGVQANISAGDNGVITPTVAGFVGNIWNIGPDGNGGLDITGGNTAFPQPGGNVVLIQFHVPNLPASTIITFDVTAGNLGLPNRPLAGAGPSDGAPFAEFHVIPEPMTLSLLALGGLSLIRRRRRA